MITKYKPRRQLRSSDNCMLVVPRDQGIWCPICKQQIMCDISTKVQCKHYTLTVQLITKQRTHYRWPIYF